jgi:hypothetical protein
MDIAKRIGAFLVAVVLPISVVIGAIMNRTEPQAYRYAAWTLDVTALAFAVIWAWRLARGKQGWLTQSVGAWFAATLVMIVVIVLREDSTGLLAWNESIAVTVNSGLYALNFWLLAFAFEGQPRKPRLRPAPDHLRRMAHHVDHEMWQLLVLCDAARKGKPSVDTELSDAIHTATAAHFRTLMEFFHDGKPDKRPGPSRAPDRRGVCYGDYLPAGERNLFDTWPLDQHRRHGEADELVAHLALARALGDWNGVPEWATEETARMVLPMIRELFRRVSGATDLFPRTYAALSLYPG